MIRYIRYLVLALLGIVLLTVALANREPVTLHALPGDLSALLGIGGQVQLPLFLVIFAGIVAGVLIGFLWEWAREQKHRSAVRGKTREVSKLERELAVLRDTKGQPADDVLALLNRPKAG
ncbi:MAG: LapA family protein [Paracoccaceae bacterium]